MIATRTRSVVKWVNVPLVVSAVLLLLYGSVMVQSATSAMGSGDAMFRRHLLGIGLGVIGMLAAWLLDLQKLKGWLGPLVLLDAFLILSPRIPGLGATAKGATSWLEVAGVRLFQPSEPAKLVTVVIMAIVIAQFKGRIERPGDMVKILGFLALPLGLILLQPDLGTGMVFVAITGGMMLIGGVRPRWIVAMGAVAAVLVVGVLALDSTLDRAFDRDVALQEYQKNRLLVFIDPSLDPSGAGYNLAQSKIAIGSGELTGKGLGSGTQSNLNFLPERHTDFIFSVLGEELGFLGGVVLLGLYLGLLVSALEVSASARDLYGSLIAAGLISMWTFQILVNIGMTIGLMPITGIPLPFMSFGSSFMITNLVGTGMLLSIWARRIGV